MPTNAPVKFGRPGAVASSDRMLASNCWGSHRQAPPSSRKPKYSRASSTSTRSSMGRPEGMASFSVNASACGESGSADITERYLPATSSCDTCR
jgi:hypothetical protein